MSRDEHGFAFYVDVIRIEYNLATVWKKMSFLLLIIAVVLTFGGAGVYAGFRVVDPLRLPRRARGFAWLVLLLPASLPFWLIIDQLEVGRWLDFFLCVTYLVLGLVSFLFVFGILRDCGWFLVRIAHRLIRLPRRFPSPLAAMRSSSIAILFLSISFSAFAVHTALSTPPVRSVEIGFNQLDPGLVGFRIVQLSDLHLGVFRGAAFLSEVVDIVNATFPDLVVITGDLTDGSVKKLAHVVTPLKHLKGPVLFVTGNHEYYWTPQEWLMTLHNLGVKVLLDSSCSISHKGATLLLVGVSDPASRMFFPETDSGLSVATSDLKATKADLRVLLAHRPATAYEALSYGFDLQLSGHTHGGQFFPWNYVINLVQPFAGGLYRLENMWIYSSRGTGFWGPPMRLGSPAEVTMITLTDASTEE